MRQPPYTTKSGLQIGKDYVPPRHVYYSRDELKLQRALIDKPVPAWRSPVAGLYIGCFATLLVIWLLTS